MRSFGMIRIRIRINDPRSLGSWRIKGTDETALEKDLSLPLMRHDPSDLGSLIEIRIISKERTRTLSTVFCGLTIFCSLREQIFAARDD